MAGLMLIIFAAACLMLLERWFADRPRPAVQGGWTQAFDARQAGPQGARERPIVFFDGACGLCDRFVHFAIAEDRNRILRFSPLQGRTARYLVDPGAIAALDSVVLVTGGRTYRRSSAVLGTLAHLGGMWRLLAMAGSLVPERWRDRLYRFIAGHRHQWFPRREACRLPSAEERALFLD